MSLIFTVSEQIGEGLLLIGFRLHVQVLVYPNVQQLAHSHVILRKQLIILTKAVDLLMKPPGLVTAGHLPVEYDRDKSIYVP